MRPFRAAVVGPLVCAILTAACTGAAPTTGPSATGARAPVHLKIAFLEDQSSDEAAVRSAPAFQGAKLAFDTAALGDGLPVSVELIGVDTGGDAVTAAAAAREIVSDQAFVGAIAAPSLTEREQSAAGDLLDRGGLPTLALSPLGPNLSNRGWTAWRRTVADVMMGGRAIAAFVDSVPSPRRGACVLGDGGSGSKAILAAVTASTTSDVVLRWHTEATETGSLRVARAVSRARCGIVVWGGSSTVGALVRRALHGAGARRITFVGGDAMKDHVYLAVSGRTGLGTVAVCPCADLSTATDLASQRFIQDYQADFGVPPGAFTAEAWDVAWMFVQAFRGGAVTRAEVLRSMWSVDRFDGLANTYVFEPTGELALGAARIHLYRDQAGRWVRLQEG